MKKKTRRFIGLAIDLLAPFAYWALVVMAVLGGNAIAIALAILATVWKFGYR
jgi:hypothetical protein